MIAAIQSLEPRMLMSAVASTTLITDEANVLSDAAALKTDLKLLFTADVVSAKQIAADFKVLPKSDQSLLKTLTSDASKGGSLITKDLNSLINPGKSAAKTAESTGISLLKKASVKLLATATKDNTKLQSSTALPLETFNSLLDGTKLTDDRNAIIAAVPTDTALITALMTQETNATANKATLQAAAVQFATDIATLVADLNSVHTAVGTFPAVVQIFSGSALETKGTHPGRSAQISIVITSEDANGNLVGTITDLSTGGGTDVLTGTVSLNGVFAAKAPLSDGTKLTLKGQVTGPTIEGTFKSPKASGSYTVTATV